MFLKTISLARAGCCPAGDVKYSFHVHIAGMGGRSDSRLTGLKIKIIMEQHTTWIVKHTLNIKLLTSPLQSMLIAHPPLVKLSMIALFFCRSSSDKCSLRFFCSNVNPFI